jgi:hypothetical protein
MSAWSDHPIVRGLGVVPGSIALVLARAFLLVAATAPGGLVAKSAFADAIGHGPLAHEPGAPLALDIVIAAVSGLAGPAGALFAVGAIAFVVVDRLLAAALVEACTPDRPLAVRFRERMTLARPHLWVALRVSLIALLFSLVLIAIVGPIFDAWARALARAGATGAERVLVGGIYRTIVILIALATGGALARVAIAVVVLDGRRRAFRAWLDAIAIAVRAPFSLVVFPMVLTLGALAVGAYATLPHVDDTPNGARFASAAAVLVLALAAWHAAIHVVTRVVASGRFDGIRARGDRPLALFAWIARLTATVRAHTR